MSTPQPVVATVDPLLSHIHSTGGQQGAWPASTTETQSDYTVVHLEEI